MYHPFLNKQILLAIAFTLIASVAEATPIIFNFTGTLGNQMLDGGALLKTWAEVPEWNGRTVSGTINMNVEGIKPAVQNHEQIFYETSTSQDASEQWLNVSLNNPDGTSFNFPTFENFPEADFNYSGTTMLQTSSGFSIFTLQRGFTNLDPDNQPHQQIIFRLNSFGDEPYQLFNSLDYNTVNFNPASANFTNSAYVSYLTANENKIEYFFRIDSLTRVESEVPEPGSLVLLLLGLISILLGRVKLGS